jgi:hypothetical protein
MLLVIGDPKFDPAFPGAAPAVFQQALGQIIGGQLAVPVSHIVFRPPSLVHEAAKIACLSVGARCY